MLLASVVLLLQASAVPATTARAIVDRAATAFYAASLMDDRTPLIAFQPTLAVVNPVPATSRFDQDGIRLFVPGDDNRLNSAREDPLLPDETSRILSAVHIPTPFAKLAPLPEHRLFALHPGQRWLMLAILQSSAATLDAWTTNRAVGAGHTELDPLLRPAAGTPAMYAAVEVVPLILDLIGLKMRHSENGLLRRAWWLPQTIGANASFGAAVRNLAVTH